MMKKVRQQKDARSDFISCLLPTQGSSFTFVELIDEPLKENHEESK
ncbi:hypothetical protein D2E26_1117 [Bifidobacterium dolichotidis]|uniref:Uncharacterized protein n=1 Tax=Bifidobacterium dolichotidis TaxID=2306976 RepID=A0A430FQE5_9BIFI|nr:hypothetical protein D2E26_1117 [Bifidobacterium dolichotidis]